MITLQLYTTFMKFSDKEYTNVIRNNHELLLDQSNPPIYNVTLEQFSVMNLLNSTNSSITNGEEYFSGVYFQVNYNASTKEKSVEYYESIPCALIY